MPKVIEGQRISAETRKVTSTTAHESAVLRTAKEIAQGLIKRPEILQVALYGKRKNKQGGYNLHLLIEVDDKKMYRRFILSLKKFTMQNKAEWQRNYSDAALRLVSLCTVWDTHTPEWRAFFALDGGDIHIDACVVPSQYSDKLKQLASDIPDSKPEFIRSLGEAVVLAAKRFEL